MDMSPNLAPAIVPPEAAKVVRAFGDEATFHLTGEQTGGRLAMFTCVTPPGGGPPPHYHDREDEWFLPLEGRVEFFDDGAWTEVPMGTGVYMPSGAIHTFRNCGDTPLRMLMQTAPAGFDVFFSRCGEEFAAGGGPDMDRIVEIAAEHGIHFVDP